MDNASEKLGQAIDRVDNMANALNIPMPAEFHIEQFKSTLPEIVAELKSAFAELTGENPWG
jgi:hypothetical protein